MIQRKRQTKKKKKSMFFFFSQIVFVVFLGFLVAWCFVWMVSNIGDSMSPMLKNGDVVFVNRIIYNAKEPKRGEVIAFKPAQSGNTYYYLKRIVGLPGESIQVKGDHIFINGKELKDFPLEEDVKDAGIAEKEFTLGENQYFVLGDRINSSKDSRDVKIGAVKKKEILGRAWFYVGKGYRFGFIKKSLSTK